VYYTPRDFITAMESVVAAHWLTLLAVGFHLVLSWGVPIYRRAVPYIAMGGLMVAITLYYSWSISLTYQTGIVIVPEREGRR
jgi:hypothetical protein